jgi:hypothetical protein
LAAPTPSSNTPAYASLLVGLLAAAAIPVAIALAELFDYYDLLEASGAIPVALALGAAAVVLARRARHRLQRTVGRVGGGRAARVGRALGVLGICLAITASISVGFYVFLTRV